jgi:hypothetical protein
MRRGSGDVPLSTSEGRSKGLCNRGAPVGRYTGIDDGEGLCAPKRRRRSRAGLGGAVSRRRAPEVLLAAVGA